MESADIYRLIGETACMLREMTRDPAIPRHAKQAMQVRIQMLEDALQKAKTVQAMTADAKDRMVEGGHCHEDAIQRW